MSSGGLSRFLGDNFGVDNVSPLWNNIASALLTVVYVKAVMDTAGMVREKWGYAEFSRKLIHVAASSFVAFWPLFDISHWGWRLNVLVPVVMTLKLFYKGAILRDPDDEDVRNMSRSSSPSELLYGPLHFTLVMIWVGIFRFGTYEGAIIMAGVGIGDGLAPLVGRTYGRHVYRMPLSSTKTLEGSVTVFLGTICGCYLYPYMIGLRAMPLRLILAYGGIAAVAEGTALSHFDNIIVPSVLHFTVGRIRELLS